MRRCPNTEFREWVADVLEGKHEPKRGRGRPKKRERLDLIRAAIEEGIEKTYGKWLADFKLNRELAWLRV